MTERQAKADWIKWITSSHCSHALTLNLNRGALPISRGREMVSALFKAIEQRRDGRKFVDQPIESRLHAFIFAEHPETNLHFHVAMKFDYWRGDRRDAEWRDFIEKKWRELSRAGSVELKRIDDEAGWAAYITKEFGRRGTDFWLAADFHSPK